MSEFTPAYTVLRRLEGGYLEDPPGYDTYAGICRKWWPHSAIWVYVDTEKPLSNGQKLKNNRSELVVESFYFDKYWDKTPLSSINKQDVATFIFCQSINEGDEAVKVAQRIVGCKDDGVLGPVTVQHINEFESDLVAKMAEDTIEFYREVAKAHPEKEKDLNGWINRVNNIIT
ncbi:MAG: putative peptidoglycan-binding domain-containing protein [Candidatus Saccharimonadales bacterium]